MNRTDKAADAGSPRMRFDPISIVGEPFMPYQQVTCARKSRDLSAMS